MSCDIIANNNPVLYHENPQGSDELLRPNIVTPLPLQTGSKLGSEIRLLCLLTGYPPLEINWFLNGENLVATNDGRISFHNNNRLLIIKNLKVEDGGSIVFQAKNQYGEVSSNCFLEITGSKKEKLLGQKLSGSPKPIRRIMHVMKRMKSF